MVVRLGELLTAVLFCLATSLSQRGTALGEISVSEGVTPRKAMRAHMGEIELSSAANAKESSSSGFRAHPEFIKSSVSSGPMWRVEANLAESLRLSGCSDTHDWHDGMTNVSDLDANAALYTEEQILEHGHPGLYLYNSEKGRTCSSYLLRQTCIAPRIFFDTDGPEMYDLLGTNASFNPCVVHVDGVGEFFNYPEDHCCVCGKGMRQKICSDDVIAHVLRQQHVLKSRVRAWFQGLKTLPPTKEQEDRAIRNILSAERDGLIEAGALSGSLDRRIGLDAVEMTNWLFTGSASYVHAGLILALHSSWRR